MARPGRVQGRQLDDSQLGLLGKWRPERHADSVEEPQYRSSLAFDPRRSGTVLFLCRQLRVLQIDRLRSWLRGDRPGAKACQLPGILAVCGYGHKLHMQGLESN